MSNRLKTYRVKVSYTFDGYIDVRESSKKNAIKQAVTAFDDPPEIVIGDLCNYSPSESHEGHVDCQFKLNKKKTHIR